MTAAAKKSRRQPSVTAQAASEDGILCPCADLSREAALSAIQANPAADFDAFLDVTKSGKTCTACRLDLEYFFVEAPRTSGRKTATSAVAEAKTRTPFKQRVYRLLDKASPAVPFNATNWMPVLYKAGVRQDLVISNYPLLFEDASQIVDYRIRCVLRNSHGEEVFRGKMAVPRGETARADLSAHFPPSSELSIGSIALDRFASAEGVRGTTRPQIELVTERASASLHFQAPISVNRRRFTFRYRPGDENIFFTVVNCAAADLSITGTLLSYPGGDSLAETSLHLGKYQSSLLPVPVPLDPERVPAGGLVTMAFDGRGFGRLHVVSSSLAGDQFSIDHI